MFDHTPSVALNVIWDPNTLAWARMGQAELNLTPESPIYLTLDQVEAKLDTLTAEVQQLTTPADTQKTEAALLSSRSEYSGGNLVYLGKAPAGSATSAAAWRINKYTYDQDGNLVQVGYADGNTNYDNSWDGRATYSYS